MRTTKAPRRIKRGIDIVVSLILLSLFSPLLLAAAALLRLQLGGPVVFRQHRTGQGQRPFTILKLRTMTDERDQQGNLLPDSERCSGLALLIRKASIDELPQLLNVLRGELSLVGPRPLLPAYDPWYTERERLRFAVPPGITGLAQISGRNTVAWDERLELDVRYVEDWSLRLDLWILFRTASKVFSGSGVVADPSALMLDLDKERGLTCARS